MHDLRLVGVSRLVGNIENMDSELKKRKAKKQKTKQNNNNNKNGRVRERERERERERGEREEREREKLADGWTWYREKEGGGIRDSLHKGAVGCKGEREWRVGGCGQREKEEINCIGQRGGGGWGV